MGLPRYLEMDKQCCGGIADRFLVASDERVLVTEWDDGMRSTVQSLVMEEYSV